MATHRHVSTLLACVIVSVANGEEFPAPGPTVWVQDDQAIQLPEVSLEPCGEPDGPGYRAYGRILLGGFISHDDEVRDNLTSTSPVHYTRLAVEQTQTLSSFGYARYHLWDWDCGGLGLPPGWRYDIDGPGVAIEFGKLPLANLHSLDAPCDPRGGWFSGFEHVNYFGYGLKWCLARDQSESDGQTNVVGRVYTDTKTHNSIIGPQLIIGRTLSKRRWLIDLNGSVAFGYSGLRMTQHTGFGESVPGGVTSTVPAEYHNYRVEHDTVGGVAEARLSSSYFIKPNWTIDLIARAFTIGPWYQAADHIIYSAPEYGLTDPNPEQVYAANLYAGFTYLR